MTATVQAETLDQKADRLARAAVKALSDQHVVSHPRWHQDPCRTCYHCGLLWPCPTVRILSAAEEAISEAETEAAARA